ncbi:hypothetical protein [Tsukamurella tyrosinosolvens]|uniref:hypothetical protein n=1 Tax=Tsukamurella tyrosinosolvens TaxID=57704 RepID=UPI002DD4309F|nr:hypothetical protein [Tsukamurella tyrosinosolvens]MEC4614029.1 hypothetical protein [Tsukamurella tyrosinosolvens]
MTIEGSALLFMGRFSALLDNIHFLAYGLATARADNKFVRFGGPFRYSVEQLDQRWSADARYKQLKAAVAYMHIEFPVDDFQPSFAAARDLRNSLSHMVGLKVEHGDWPRTPTTMTYWTPGAKGPWHDEPDSNWVVSKRVEHVTTHQEIADHSWEIERLNKCVNVFGHLGNVIHEVIEDDGSFRSGAGYHASVVARLWVPRRLPPEPIDAMSGTIPLEYLTTGDFSPDGPVG